MANPDDRLYHKEHTWAHIEGKRATIGITDHAQAALGDIVYIDLPDIDNDVTEGDEITEIESTKATSAVISPVSGRIIKVNESLEDEPEIINEEPYEKGWILMVELDDTNDTDSLLDAESYTKYVEEEAE